MCFEVKSEPARDFAAALGRPSRQCKLSEPRQPHACQCREAADAREVDRSQRSDILIPLKEADASNPACRPWSFRTTPVEFCSCTIFAPPAIAMLPETAV